MNEQSYKDQVLLEDIKRLSNLVRERFSQQNELNLLQENTPQDQEVIAEKNKAILGLSQEINNLSLYLRRVRIFEHYLNRKRWAVLIGLFASPELALSLLTGWQKEPPRTGVL